MSTLAPDRPDTLTAEDAGLLQALDPDTSSTCVVVECERPAAFHFSCTRCNVGDVMCAGHTQKAVTRFEVWALLHRPQSCHVCDFSYCMHRWRECILVTPIAAASS